MGNGATALNRNASVHTLVVAYRYKDPFYCLMLVARLGPDYGGGETAQIEFVSLGEGRVRAVFEWSEAQIADIQAQAASVAKCCLSARVLVTDADGDVVARIRKTLYIARKRRARPAPEKDRCRNSPGGAFGIIAASLQLCAPRCAPIMLTDNTHLAQNQGDPDTAQLLPIILWGNGRDVGPLSRRDLPKQFAPLVHGHSLLHLLTLERARLLGLRCGWWPARGTVLVQEALGGHGHQFWRTCCLNSVGRNTAADPWLLFA